MSLRKRRWTATSSLQTESVVLIDNYDSFTYNLSQYLGQIGCDHQVIRNDDISIDELSASSPRGIIISPGPGELVVADVTATSRLLGELQLEKRTMSSVETRRPARRFGDIASSR